MPFTHFAHHISSFLDRMVTSFAEQQIPGQRTCPMSTVTTSSTKKVDLNGAIHHAEISRQFANSFKDTTFTAAAGTPQEHVMNIYSQSAANAVAELSKGIDIMKKEGYQAAAPQVDMTAGQRAQAAGPGVGNVQGY
ncbi:unnamed protein product [Amoebophrya sp. A120]|nr:unnamed protein product [Amoebophrya sp. A120]|eukprot:GSA120T00022125001.1